MQKFIVFFNLIILICGPSALAGQLENIEKSVQRIELAQAIDRLVAKTIVALEEKNLAATTKYWKVMMNTPDVNITNILEEVFDNFYHGKSGRIPILIEFIETCVRRDDGVEATTEGLKSLLGQMKYYGDYYISSAKIQKAKTEYAIGRGNQLKRYIFFVLEKLAAKYESEILRKSVIPAIAIPILSGSSVTIKNKFNGNLLYINNNRVFEGNNWEVKNYSAVLTAPKPLDSYDMHPFLWKFVKVETRWRENIEQFFIHNKEGDRRLRVGIGLMLVDPTQRKYQDLWSFFYVHLVSDTEIIIQCDYKVLTTLAIGDNGVTPEFIVPSKGDELGDKAIWIVEEVPDSY